MKEVEVKILDVDVDNVKSQLAKLGAKKVFDGKLISQSFDFEDERMEKDGCFLRLRKAGEKCFVTYKGKVEDSELKIREEDEVEVSDFDVMVKILNNLGLKVIGHYEKFRESYVFKDMRFELDSYPEMATFLEVEAPDEERVKEGLKLLGFNLDKAIKKSALEILKEHGVFSEKIKFK